MIILEHYRSIYIYISSHFSKYYRNLCTSSQTFDLGLEQYLVLTEDEEVQEEENLMTDMFRCKDGGSNDGSTSSDETDSSSQPNKKKRKPLARKARSRKLARRRPLRNRRSQRSQKKQRMMMIAKTQRKQRLQILKKRFARQLGVI